jgi:HlyD family secretion protein
VRPDHPANVEIDGLDKPLAGRVTQVSRQEAFTPHYALTEKESAHLVFEARVTLDDAPDGLRPGLPARVRLELGH